MFNETLVTVWSAPNYCYRYVRIQEAVKQIELTCCFRCGNVAAILELDEHLTKHFKIFEAAPQVLKQAFTRYGRYSLASFI